MKLLIKVLVAFLIVNLLISCAGRRERQRAQQEMMQKQMQPPLGPSCTAPAAGSCQTCSIQCPVGQPALCKPGDAVANTCAVQSSCRCGPPS